MRDQLRDVEGQLIFIEGRVTSYSNRNGKKYICLQRPLVIPWDGNAALKASAEHQLIDGLDHLWVQTSGHDQIEMMRHVLSCSRVKWYARKDGTVDLGTEPLHCLYNHDRRIEEFVAARKAGQLEKNHRASHLADQLGFCDFYLDILTNQGRIGEESGKPEWIYSCFYSCDELIDWYTQYKKEILDALQHFDKAQKKVELQAQRGRCRSAGRFADLLR